jgi:hypothetical protein
MNANCFYLALGEALRAMASQRTAARRHAAQVNTLHQIACKVCAIARQLKRNDNDSH